MKRTAAAQFTEITLEEMEKFLKRAFRALEPEKGSTGGEVHFDLSLSDDIVIRVFTSVGVGRNQAAGVGADAIRVGLYRKPGKPLKGGKWPIVKRTQGWKDNLRSAVETWIEMFHEHEDELEAGKFVNW